MYGTPGNLTPGTEAAVTVMTIHPDDGTHGVFFEPQRRRLARLPDALRPQGP